MYNCWNEAIAYLIKRLGKSTTDIRVRDRKGNIQRCQKVDTYNTAKLQQPQFQTELTIHTLLGQYNYGIAAKRDLYNILLNLGVIKETEKNVV